MTTNTSQPRKKSNAYNIFILVLTVLSLLIMVLLILPLSDATLKLLGYYDNLICIIFLIDFFSTLFTTPKKSDYFIRGRGWLDLLGSIPSFGILQYGGLLRLARLSRFARIFRLMRGENKKELIEDVVTNRSQYAGFITLLLVILVLTISSIVVLEYESASPDASIKTGWDALWYAVVTITTVGYGDFYPVTTGGRIAAMFIMFSGVGIIGALSSILASVLLGGGESEKDEAPTKMSTDQELAEIRKELAELRKSLQAKKSKK